MTINVRLSTESIDAAIERLQRFQDDLEHGINQTVEILTNEGAEIAQAAYGDFPVSATPHPDGTTGTIVVEGDVPLIAEFGAGDQTLSGGFENTPAEARPGSYSEEHARQYSRWGFWYFAGEPYTEVYPHHGLLDAKRHIIANSTDVAMGVFGGD